MTPSQLKYKHELNNPNSYFFTSDTMKFFGDTMRNYGCRFRNDLNAWELHRKTPVKHGLTASRFFHLTTFEIIHE